MVSCGWETFSPGLISWSNRAWLMPGTEKKSWRLAEKGLCKHDEMGNNHYSWGLVIRPSLGGVGGQRSAGVGEYLGIFSVGSPCHFCPLKSSGTWSWALSRSQQDTDFAGSVVGVSPPFLLSSPRPDFIPPMGNKTWSDVDLHFHAS